MTISLHLEDSITEEIRDEIVAYCRKDPSDFASEAKYLGLDKKSDFICVNLAGASFSDADIRGFDFTGSDLRGVTGKNVKWDETTILDYASVDGSIFAYELHKSQFFASNPQWHSEFLRRRKDVWTRNTIWLADEVLGRSKNKGSVMEVAKALFDDTRDNFLRSQILFFLAPTFDNRNDHKDFLLHTMAKYGDQPLIVRATIRTLAVLFRDDRSIFDILNAEVSSADFDISSAAMRGVISSKFIKDNIAEIGAKCSRFPSDIRRHYVKRISVLLGPYYKEAVREPMGSIPIDFAEKINRSKILSISHAIVIRRKQVVNLGRRHEGGMPVDPKASFEEVAAESRNVEYSLHRMRDCGVPFYFE